MRLKPLIIAMILSFLFAGTGTLLAQGIYSSSSADKNKNTMSDIKTLNDQNEDSGMGIFRGIGDPNGDGDRPPAPGGDSEEDPIGEGLLFLSLLAGGYAMLRKKIKGENEK